MISLASLGVREVVIGLVALLSLYLVVSVLRLFFVDSKPRRPRIEARPTVAKVDVTSEDDDGDEEDDLPPLYAAVKTAAKSTPVAAIPATRSLDDVLAAASASDIDAAVKRSRFAFVSRLFRRRQATAARLEPDLPAAIEAAPSPQAWPPAAPVIDFARELARSNLEVEVQRLQREGAVLRDELARLSEEVVRLKSARNVSPLYTEAMSLAQRGMEAVSIADRCGISMGEAELVAALAKGRPEGAPEFEHAPQREDRDERYTERGNRRHA